MMEFREKKKIGVLRGMLDEVQAELGRMDIGIMRQQDDSIIITDIEHQPLVLTTDEQTRIKARLRAKGRIE